MRYFFRFSLVFFSLIVSQVTSAEPTPPTQELPYPYVEEIKTENDGSPFLKEFLNMLWTLGLLLGGLFLVAYLLRRLLNARQDQANVTSAIKIMERRALSNKTSLYLIEVGEKAIVLSEGSNGVTLLDVTPKKSLENGS